jgi:hypothetical protein
MPGTVVIRTFSYRHEAELFKSILESHGIASFVGTDDEGAQNPGLGFVRGVRLWVAEEDAIQASDVLDSYEDTPDAAEDNQGPPPAP